MVTGNNTQSGSLQTFMVRIANIQPVTIMKYFVFNDYLPWRVTSSLDDVPFIGKIGRRSPHQ